MSQGFSDSGEPEQERKMFIGGLCRETDEDTLRRFYEQFGNIMDLFISRDASTMQSKCFGFVTFEHSSSVQDSLSKLPHVIDGKVVDPKVAKPKEQMGGGGGGGRSYGGGSSGGDLEDNSAPIKKCFVGGIPLHVDGPQLKEMMSEHGPVEEVEMMLDRDTGRSRGFAFVSFANVETADKLCAVQFIDVQGKKVEVKRAMPRGAAGISRGGFRGGRGGGDRGGFRGRGRGGFGGGRGRGFNGGDRGGYGGGGYGRGGGGGGGRESYGSAGYGGGSSAYGGQQSSYGGGAYGGSTSYPSAYGAQSGQSSQYAGYGAGASGYGAASAGYAGGYGAAAAAGGAYGAAAGQAAYGASPYGQAATAAAYGQPAAVAASGYSQAYGAADAAAAAGSAYSSSFGAGYQQQPSSYAAQRPTSGYGNGNHSFSPY